MQLKCYLSYGIAPNVHGIGSVSNQIVIYLYTYFSINTNIYFLERICNMFFIIKIASESLVNKVEETF